MDHHSPEIYKVLAALIRRTAGKELLWEVAEYAPISFMTEVDPKQENGESENFVQQIAFQSRSQKGRIIWLEIYESIGLAVSERPGQTTALRGLGRCTLRFLSSRGQLLFQMDWLLQKKGQYPLLSLLTDAVFISTRSVFSHMPESDPLHFFRHLRGCDESGGLERHPLSLLMAEFYRQNRCRDFHLLSRAATPDAGTNGENRSGGK